MERTYRAKTYAEALSRVRRELGPDAVILSSKQSGRFGHGVEVSATTPADIHSAHPEGVSAQGERVLEQRMLRMGIPLRAAKAFIGRLRIEHGRVPHSIAHARPSIETVLGEELVFAGGVTGTPRCVALVGPTGVGKTTTIAKIAAQQGLGLGRTVGLISTDMYRVAGAEQLKRYAELMDVPIETAATDKELRTAIRRMDQCDLIFIDTAGRSPSDTEALRAMGEQLHGCGESVEVHLCVQAATSEVEQRAIVGRHAMLHPTRLLITKLDEAVYHGSIISAQALVGLPFSYFTTGQRVPEDIELASSERLAALLCGEEVHA